MSSLLGNKNKVLCHSSEDALPEITNEDNEIITIKEELEDFVFDSTQDISNAKHIFNNFSIANPHKRTLLNPSDEQSIAVEKFHKPKEISKDIAPINNSIEETYFEIKTEESMITNVSPIRPFDAMNFVNHDVDMKVNVSTNDFLVEKFGSIHSGGSEYQDKFTANKSLVASMEIICPVPKEKIRTKVHTNIEPVKI